MVKLSLATFFLLLSSAPFTTLSITTSDTGTDISLDTTNETNKELLFAKFKEWVDEHAKKYTSLGEYMERFAIWAENNAYINTHNNQNPKPSYTLGHNHFSDLTNEEYKRYNFLGEYATPSNPRTSLTADTRHLRQRDLAPSDVPKSVDWVKKGACTEIKNQEKCGSCWSFSAVAAVESAMYIKTGILESLSNQQLMDCDKTDLGCNGGLMDTAFEYIETAGGLCTYESYPYEATKSKCRIDNCTIVKQSDVINFVDVNPTMESLKAAIAVQPVSVGIEADQLSFQLYKEGVYNATCGTNLDHGVVAVGYGTDEESGKDFWLIRNSWGPTWGEDGYIKIAQEAKTDKGNCGIYEVASRPIV